MRIIEKEFHESQDDKTDTQKEREHNHTFTYVGVKIKIREYSRYLIVLNYHSVEGTVQWVRKV